MLAEELPPIQLVDIYQGSNTGRAFLIRKLIPKGNYNSWYISLIRYIFFNVIALKALFYGIFSDVVLCLLEVSFYAYDIVETALKQIKSLRFAGPLKY